MSAAIRATQHGLSTVVVDEHVEPGGQIWRAIERVAGTPRAAKLGSAYTEGAPAAERFRACGAEFKPQTTLWHIEAGPCAFLKSEGRSFALNPGAVLLATGAQERPVPFEGWTLPGVMTVGAGQIMLKSAGQVPDRPVWIAGCGPLAYLFAVQLLDIGADIAGFLDTTPPERLFRQLPHLLNAALSQPADIAKGARWLARIKSNCTYIASVRTLRAKGNGKLSSITYEAGNRESVTVPADILMVHEGIVPGIHPTMSLGCAHSWNETQAYYAPSLDDWGETTEGNIFVAGDGAGIAGAKAACARGELAAIGIARKLGKLSNRAAATAARPVRKTLAKAMSTRPFLEGMYRPRPSILSPDDRAMACRCEEVTAGQIRELCRTGKAEPNRIKAFSRAGMGPCQGRLCNYTVAQIIASETSIAASEIGLYRVRPPFKPLSLDELSSLAGAEEASK